MIPAILAVWLWWSAQTQAALNREAAQDYARQDAELNQVYRRAAARLSKERAASLQKAQRAWIAFRDAECAFRAADADGGSMQLLLRYGCLSELTKERVDRLEKTK